MVQRWPVAPFKWLPSGLQQMADALIFRKQVGRWQIYDANIFFSNKTIFEHLMKKCWTSTNALYMNTRRAKKKIFENKMFIASVSLGLCTFQFKHVRQQSEPSKKQKQKKISLENVAWNLKASMNRCLKWTPVCTWGHRGLLSVYRWMTSQCQNPSEMNRTTDSKISLPRQKPPGGNFLWLRWRRCLSAC